MADVVQQRGGQQRPQVGGVLADLGWGLRAHGSQRPQQVATPSSRCRSATDEAPRSTQALISRSVMPLQMQTYMGLPFVKREVLSIQRPVKAIKISVQTGRICIEFDLYQTVFTLFYLGV